MLKIEIQVAISTAMSQQSVPLQQVLNLNSVLWDRRHELGMTESGGEAQVVGRNKTLQSQEKGVRPVRRNCGEHTIPTTLHEKQRTPLNIVSEHAEQQSNTVTRSL